MDFGETIKLTWSSDSAEPPVPHAEEMTISELALAINKIPGQLVQHLLEHKIESDTSSVIKDLAEKNHLSPQELYAKMQIHSQQKSPDHIKRGYGRKSIGQICKESNLSVQIALQRLQKNGIEATTTTNIRELADRHDRSPSDIVNMILVKSNSGHIEKDSNY
jgi:replication initiation and membrane attachment protein DnaB